MTEVLRIPRYKISDVSKTRMFDHLRFFFLTAKTVTSGAEAPVAPDFSDGKGGLSTCTDP